MLTLCVFFLSEFHLIFWKLLDLLKIPICEFSLKIFAY